MKPLVNSNVRIQFLIVGNRNSVNFNMAVNTYECCLDFSRTIRAFYMFYVLMFLCYLSINVVRKHKCVIHFNFIIFIIFDSIQSKVVFEGMVLIQNGFSFNLRLSSNGV